MLRCQHASHRCSAPKLPAVTVIVLMPRIFVSCCLASFTEHSHQPHSSQLGFVLNQPQLIKKMPGQACQPKCESPCSDFLSYAPCRFKVRGVSSRHPRRLEHMCGFAHSLFETPAFCEVSWPQRAFSRHRVFATISRHFVGFGAYFVCVAYVACSVILLQARAR